MRQLNTLKQKMKRKLARLLSDVRHWMEDHHVELEDFHERRREFLDQVGSSIDTAVAIAPRALLAKTSEFNLRKLKSNSGFRFELLCQQNTLDGYFSSPTKRWEHFALASKKLLDAHTSPTAKRWQKTVDLLAAQFPLCTSLVAPAMPLRFDPSRTPSGLVIQAVQSFPAFFAPIPPLSTSPLVQTFAKTGKIRRPRQEVNLLVGDHRDKLEFLLEEFTIDLGTHIEHACGDECGKVALWNFSNDCICVELHITDQRALFGRLKSSTVPAGGRIEIATL
jgi:hypothetical protein